MSTGRRRWALAAACAGLGLVVAPAGATGPSGWVAQDDLVVRAALREPTQALPLGNGDLGAAVWQADGLTVQLNRTGQFPAARSAGWLTVPGLRALADATDAGGRLVLHDGELVLTGGGRRAVLRVDRVRDQLVLDATGFGAEPQTAVLGLWEGRTPKASAAGGVAALAERQTDALAAGGPRTSGALAALAAPGARDVVAERVDAEHVRLRFRPRPDGSFRLVVAVPSWTGEAIDQAARRAVDSAADRAAHLRWWHRFWDRATPMVLHSADGAADYLGQLRTLWLYTAAAAAGHGLPNTHGGVANLFTWTQDTVDWSPVGYWHYNQRQAAYAALGAGVPELDAPYFRLYRERLATMAAWTREHTGLPGVCISEVLRYDGTGRGDPDFSDCDTAAAPSFHARLLSTGPEIALNAWLRYRYTGDERFLRDQWPLIRETTRFLVAYGLRGADADGVLHTDPSNGLETYWDARDPATDVAALRVMVPLTARIARQLGQDEDLARQLDGVAERLPPLPSVPGGPLLAAARLGPAVNVEPVTTEPIWPWGLLGDRGDAAATAAATYRAEALGRLNSWSMLPVVAARAGLAGDVASELVREVRDFQLYPTGFAIFSAPADVLRARYVNPYLELGGATAAALQEALVQAYDGVLRITPAWPDGWDADGRVAIEGGHGVSVRVRDGRPQTVVIDPGSDNIIRLRSPWTGAVTELPLRKGARVVLRAPGAPEADVAPDGAPVREPRRLAGRTLGVPGSGAVPDAGPAPTCRSRRRVTITLPRRTRSVVVRVDGQRAAARRSGRRITVDLTGPRPGRVTITVRFRTAQRRVVLRRAVRTCGPARAR